MKVVLESLQMLLCWLTLMLVFSCSVIWDDLIDSLNNANWIQEEPKKVCFNYDLFLNLEGNPPVNHLRCEKLTFNNPTRDFRRKLVKAGGVSAALWEMELFVAQFSQENCPFLVNVLLFFIHSVHIRSWWSQRGQRWSPDPARITPCFQPSHSLLFLTLRRARLHKDQRFEK